MSHRSKYAIIVAVLMSTLACGVLSAPPTPTPTAQPPAAVAASDTPAAAATAAPADTAAPSAAAAAPTDTPNPLTGGLPAPFANLQNASQYLNPVGQPVQNWKGIPIMSQAIAGQEWENGSVYSFKATGTIADAVAFYQAQMPTAGFTSLMPAPGTGTAGTGSNAIHDSFLMFNKGTQVNLFYIVAYDNDPSHVSVVISGP